MGLGERAPEFEIATIDWWRAVGRSGGEVCRQAWFYRYVERRYVRLRRDLRNISQPAFHDVTCPAPRDMHLYAQPEKYLTKKRLKRAVRTDVAAI